MLELFHERAIRFSFFTKMVYGTAFSRKSNTVELFYEKGNLAFGQLRRGGGTPSPIDNHDYQWGEASPHPSLVDQMLGYTLQLFHERAIRLSFFTKRVI